MAKGLSFRERSAICTVIWAALWLGLTVFIFSNSLQSGEQSGAHSGWWAAFLRPILDPGHGLADTAFHALVRKLAHMAEFCALAVAIGGTTVQLGKITGRRYICLPLLAALCTAVCDEFLQTFTADRAGQVSDVLVDMAGALIGFGLVAAVCVIGKTIRKRREKICEN